MIIRSYRKFDICASSIYVKQDDKILVVSVAPSINKLRLLLLNPSKSEAFEVVTLKGSRSLFLNEVKGRTFIGVDNKLLASKDQDLWKVVLESKRLSNLFWHMTTSKDGMIYVQEYGEPPTGIYASEDGEKWELLVTAQEIDNAAKHFHSIAYDQYRDMLIATLGDRNYVRIAVSYNGGRSWRPAYKGPWQVLPIVILKDRIVFGMDSGIAKGGLIIWNPDEDRYKILHLKWRENKVKLMQMADLKLLSNGTWVATLGTPQAIIASSDLKNWYMVYIEGFNGAFHNSIAIGEGENIVTFATGKSVILMKKNDLAKQIKEASVIYEHRATLEKLIGFGYTLKKKFFHLIKDTLPHTISSVGI